MLQRLVTVVAFVASLAALLVFAGGGLALFAISMSGVRGSGAVTAVASILAFGLAMALAFAPRAAFEGQGRSAGAIAAGFLAAIPVGLLAAAAIRFAGVPFTGPTPVIDLAILLVGLALVAGAAAIIALGYRRAREAMDPMPVVVHMQQIRHAQEQLRAAFYADLKRPVPAGPASAGSVAADLARPLGVEDDSGEIRVRRV